MQRPEPVRVLRHEQARPPAQRDRPWQLQRHAVARNGDDRLQGRGVAGHVGIGPQVPAVVVPHRHVRELQSVVVPQEDLLRPTQPVPLGHELTPGGEPGPPEDVVAPQGEGAERGPQAAAEAALHRPVRRPRRDGGQEAIHSDWGARFGRFARDTPLQAQPNVQHPRGLAGTDLSGGPGDVRLAPNRSRGLHRDQVPRAFRCCNLVCHVGPRGRHTPSQHSGIVPLASGPGPAVWVNRRPDGSRTTVHGPCRGLSVGAGSA
mmetsp:Transcript_145128/g.253153  ORF Transcript_145128/g.253153 Transcript_145128/m.253153 type:complete len:261 (+) Transcript_145128:975-1757(+)